MEKGSLKYTIMVQTGHMNSSRRLPAVPGRVWISTDETRSGHFFGMPLYVLCASNSYPTYPPLPPPPKKKKIRYLISRVFLQSMNSINGIYGECTCVQWASTKIKKKDRIQNGMVAEECSQMKQQRDKNFSTRRTYRDTRC